MSLSITAAEALYGSLSRTEVRTIMTEGVSGGAVIPAAVLTTGEYDTVGSPTADFNNAIAIAVARALTTLPHVLAPYPKASLPSAATWVRGLIYVTDEAGGAVPAFSDGTNWRRVTDRAIVS
jgi:hypothetical protein